MVFSSLTFLFIYFPITLMVMKLSPLKYRNFCLLVLSLLFYSYGEPKYIIIMLVSCIVDYFNGYMVDKYRDNKRISAFPQKHKKKPDLFCKIMTCSNFYSIIFCVFSFAHPIFSFFFSFLYKTYASFRSFLQISSSNAALYT